MKKILMFCFPPLLLVHAIKEKNSGYWAIATTIFVIASIYMYRL